MALRKILISNSDADELEMSYTDNLEIVTFNPLEERIKTNPRIIAGLAKLRETISPEEYERYINGLLALKEQQGKFLLITRNGIDRSIIAKEYLGYIQEAFGTENVKIVAQSLI